jgi:lipopolysaccharide heptosyltransferase II
MNDDSKSHRRLTNGGTDDSPILVVPYMWIGDFVRCHSVVQLLQARFPNRPVDVLATPLCAPLADYMPSVRQSIIADLPRGQLALAKQRALAELLSREGYGTSLVMPSTWKSTLAPFLAGIPERIGWVGEGRFVLLNDARWGRLKLPRMVDQCAALALPRGTTLPAEWPKPELKVPAGEITAWRREHGLTAQPAVALAPGAIGPAKRWTTDGYAALTRRLLTDGFAVWVVGGPGEKVAAQAIVGDTQARDLTGTDLREAILALAAATAAVSNDSGLLHVAAAVGTPTVGIFGPTSPWHWAPLNPLAATIQAKIELPCRPCHKPVCRFGHHRCMTEITADEVYLAASRALEAAAVSR